MWLRSDAIKPVLEAGEEHRNSKPTQKRSFSDFAQSLGNPEAVPDTLVQTSAQGPLGAMHRGPILSPLPSLSGAGHQELA